MSRIRNCRDNLMFIAANGQGDDTDVAAHIKTLEERFIEAMDDDLNTAGAIGAVFEYIKDINIAFERGGSKKSAEDALRGLDTMLDVLGLVPREESIPGNIKDMADKRQQARARKDFKAADALRDEILSLGYEIKDTPEGVKINRRV